MSKKRRQHSPDLKARVGLEALKGVEPVHAIAAKYGVHPVQVSKWKKEAAEGLPEVFSRRPDAEAEAAKSREKELFEEIGRLKMELESGTTSWLRFLRIVRYPGSVSLSSSGIQWPELPWVPTS